MKSMQWAAAVCLAGWAALAAAQAPLSADQIDRWVGAMGDLDSWAEETGLGEEDFAVEEGHMPDFSVVLQRLGEHQAGFERVLSKHGFEDAAAWADVSNRITGAYLAMVWRDSAEERAAARDEMRTAMREQLRQIEQDPNLSDEQKVQFRQQIEQVSRMYEGDEAGEIFGFEASEADITAVRARRGVLDDMFGAMAEDED